MPDCAVDIVARESARSAHHRLDSLQKEVVAARADGTRAMTTAEFCMGEVAELRRETRDARDAATSAALTGLKTQKSVNRIEGAVSAMEKRSKGWAISHATTETRSRMVAQFVLAILVGLVVALAGLSMNRGCTPVPTEVKREAEKELPTAPARAEYRWRDVVQPRPAGVHPDH